MEEYERLYWVNSKYACAGVFVGSAGIIVETAPIYRKLLGKHIEQIPYETKLVGDDTMIGTVKTVDPDARAGKWPVTKLTLDTEKGERSYNIFKREPFHDTVIKLQPGQTVELAMVKKGQYWNVSDVTVVQGGSNGNGGSRGGYSNPEKDKEIRRAVALKAAIELIAGTLTSKSNVEEAARNAVLVAPIFEPYLETGDVNFAVVSEFDSE